MGDQHSRDVRGAGSSFLLEGRWTKGVRGRGWGQGGGAGRGGGWIRAKINRLINMLVILKAPHCVYNLLLVHPV